MRESTFLRMVNAYAYGAAFSVVEVAKRTPTNAAIECRRVMQWLTGGVFVFSRCLHAGMGYNGGQ